MSYAISTSSLSSAPRRAAAPAFYAEGHWLHPILICLLYLTMALSFVAAQWTETGSGVFLGAMAGALLCGLLVTYAHVSYPFMVGFGLLASLCWTLFLVSSQIPEADLRSLMLQDFTRLQSRAYLLMQYWGDWTGAVLRRQASDNNLVFLFNMAFLLWWIAYFGSWTLLRFGLAWRSVLMAGLVTGVNTFYAPEPVMGLFVFFILIALVLLMSAYLLSLQWHWRHANIRFSQDILFDFMRNGLVFSLLVTGVAWGIPRLGLFQTVNNMLAPVSRVWENTTDQIAAWNQGLNQQIRAGNSATFLNTLTLGGARQASTDAVMRVEALEGRYWRANVYDAFDGTQWRNTFDSRQALEAGQAIPVPAWQSRVPLRQTIYPLQDLGYVLMAAPDIVETSMATTVRYEAVPLLYLEDPLFLSGPLAEEAVVQTAAQELHYVQTRELIAPDTPYQVLSTLTRATVWDMENALDYVPPALAERYLQVPDSVDPRVEAHAQELTADETSRYGKAKALETALRRIEYDDQIEAAPPGTDPIGYFLFDLQRGYCDYYATSMVIMLRLLGIPARLAAGYAEGTYETENGTFLVTEQDAHTWVEVYFPDLGWIEFEPTAGESVLIREPGGDPEPERAGNAAPAGPLSDNPQDLLEQMLDEDTALDLAFEDFGDETGQSPRVPIGLLAALAGLGLGGGLLLRLLASLPRGRALLASLGLGFLLARGRTGAGRETEVASTLRQTYHHLMQWARRLRIPMAASTTPFERGTAISRLLPDLARPVQVICQAFVQQQYGTWVSGLVQSTAQVQVERAWRAIQIPLLRHWLHQYLQDQLRHFRRKPLTPSQKDTA